MYPQELDWGVTFSKFSFPWHDVAFGKFTAKDCYIKYTTTVREARVFFKKILQSQERFRKYIQDYLDEPPRFAQDESSPNDQAGYECETYCICKGKVKSGYFVACEADEDCPNGGWLHPECTKDLSALTQEAIDQLDQWYCETCVERIDKENEEPSEGKEDSHSQSDDAIS